jgi:hypothetical protein
VNWLKVAESSKSSKKNPAPLVSVESKPSYAKHIYILLKLAISINCNQNIFMSEITRAQYEILNRPFIGVNPGRIISGLWKTYEALWVMENGVLVRATKYTIRGSHVNNDGFGNFAGTSLFVEATQGYRMELAQKFGNKALGDMVLGHSSAWGYISKSTNIVEVLKERDDGYRYAVDKNSELSEGPDMFAALDSKEKTGTGIVTFPRESRPSTVTIPHIDTVEDLVDVFGSFKKPDQ